VGEAVSDVLHFLVAVAGYWATLLTGGVIIAITAALEHKKGRNLSWRLYRWLMVFFLLVACFLAWRSENHHASDVDAERQRLAGENAKLQGEKSELEKSLREKDKPIQVQLPPPQPPVVGADSGPRVVRETLAKYIQQGEVIRTKFAVRGMLGDWSPGPLAAKKEMESWSNRVTAFLNAHFDRSYAVRFQAQDEQVFVNNPPIPADFSNLAAVRIRRLKEFLAQIGAQ
jgi:hypothetical protein